MHGPRESKTLHYCVHYLCSSDGVTDLVDENRVKGCS